MHPIEVCQGALSFLLVDLAPRGVERMNQIRSGIGIGSGRRKFINAARNMDSLNGACLPWSSVHPAQCFVY